MAGLSMCEFGWSGIEPMGLYCVDNNLIIIINVDLLDVLLLLKQKTVKAFPVFDRKHCPVFSSISCYVLYHSNEQFSKQVLSLSLAHPGWICSCSFIFVP